MAKKILVVVDVQNDFAKGGVLAYGYPKKVNTDEIVNYVKKTLEDGGLVIATRDTHHSNYMTTLEGQKLPVEHCIHETRGWQLVDGLNEIANTGAITVVDKPTFGTSLVGELVRSFKESFEDIDEVQFIGYCTSICVTACAVMLRAYMPNQKISVIESLCGDIDEESHKAALKVLENQQIEVRCV